jgi:hypothetical protein
MKKRATCPKCHVALEGAGISCADCGWSERAERSERQRLDPQRFQCAWVADGLRCRYPGTIAQSTNGTGPHYCRWHYQCADPVHGARLVQESQGYQAEDADLHLAIMASLKQHGLERRAGESTADHIERMRAFCLAGLRQWRQRNVAQE